MRKTNVFFGITIFLGISLIVYWQIIDDAIFSKLWFYIDYYANKCVVEPIKRLFTKTVFTIPFAIILSMTLVLEQILPADKRQKVLSLSFFQDLIWFFYEKILHATILVVYVYWVKEVYFAHFSFLTIEVADQVSYWLRFFIGVFLLDFLYWFQHYLNHKVPWFWYFHTVHHSQKHLNFFTDFRYHIFEYVVRETILIIPFLILKIDVPTIVAFSLFRKYYSQFYHGNIKTDLGPLRYILVTPQSHRIHHSVDKKHYDQNFGSIFSIWDYIFKTQFTGFDEYPKTGVPNEDFPHETTAKGLHLITQPVHQLIYPFKLIGRDIIVFIRKIGVNEKS